MTATALAPSALPSAGVVLEVSDLTKRFGQLAAVDHLSFTVQPARVTGFLGPNGAGKTTTMRMLLGLVAPTSGSALIAGQRYRDLPNPMRVVGSALEATNFHPGRSGRDHLRVLADASGIPTRRVDEMLELVGIPAAARQRAGGYSMGMRQRLGLAAALLGDPAVLMLDEPANGLDPEGIRWLRSFLRHLAAQGKTILISSHMLAEADLIVDDVVIIANGRSVAQGSMADLRGEPTVFVKSSDNAALASALTARGVLTSPSEGGGLVARTGDPARVGDIALAAGLPIHELHPLASDLEDLFFRLTDTPENRNRNLRTDGQPFIPPAGQSALPVAPVETPEAGENLMTAAIKSEFRKFFTTRLWWGMAIGVFLAGAAFAALFASLDPTPEMTGGVTVPNLSDPSRVASVYTGGLSVSYLLTLAIGVMTIGSEYRHKTITSTFLATPIRSKVMGAKVVSLAGIGAFYGLVSLVGAVSVGATIIAIRGFSPFPDSSIWRTLALSLLVLAVWALIGLGAGILIPNQVAALLISIGLAWIVEPLVGFLIGAQSWGKGAAPYFPSNATAAALGGNSAAGSFTPLSWWAAALVLVGYAAIMTLVGSFLTVRRDVS